MDTPKYVFCPRTGGMVAIDNHCEAGCERLFSKQRRGVLCTAEGATEYPQKWMNETLRQAEERMMREWLYKDESDFKIRFIKTLRMK